MDPEWPGAAVAVARRRPGPRRGAAARSAPPGHRARALRRVRAGRRERAGRGAARRLSRVGADAPPRRFRGERGISPDACRSAAPSQPTGRALGGQRLPAGRLRVRDRFRAVGATCRGDGGDRRDGGRTGPAGGELANARTGGDRVGLGRPVSRALGRVRALGRSVGGHRDAGAAARRAAAGSRTRRSGGGRDHGGAGRRRTAAGRLHRWATGGHPPGQRTRGRAGRTGGGRWPSLSPRGRDGPPGGSAFRVGASVAARVDRGCCPRRVDVAPGEARAGRRDRWLRARRGDGRRTPARAPPCATRLWRGGAGRVCDAGGRVGRRATERRPVDGCTRHPSRRHDGARAHHLPAAGGAP